MYSQLVNYTTQMQQLIIVLDDLYAQISSSFLNTLTAAFNANLIMIFIVAYGVLAAFVLLSFFCEFMFFKKRDRKIYRTLINLFWCFFAPAAVAFAGFLSILAPLTAAGTEFHAMLEPTLLNRTFYGKLEYPSDQIKGGLYPCTHGNGKFHTSGMPFGNPIIQFSDFADYLNVTMNMGSNIDAINSKFTAVTNQMNTFGTFGQDFYAPPTTSNQNRKISIMIQVLNAYTNAATPYTFNGVTINQVVIFVHLD
jgi:hypothetical protein